MAEGAHGILEGRHKGTALGSRTIAPQGWE